MSDSRVFGFDLSYQVKGGPKDPLAVQQLSTAFERAAVEVGRFGEYAFPRLIPVLEKEVKGQFDAEGHGPNRGKWRALDPEYARRKEKQYPGKKILERTGRLKAAMTNSHSPFANRAYSATTLNYGSHGVNYASFHQTGAQYAWWDASGSVDKHSTGSRELIDRPIFDFTADFAAGVRAAALAGARDLIKASQVDKFTSGNPAATNAALDAALDSALARDE